VKKSSIIKFTLYSLIGIFVFFIPVNIDGKTTIFLDHIITAIKNNFPGLSAFYALLIIFLGGAYPFISGEWKKDSTAKIFSILKVIGVITALMNYFHFGPEFLFSRELMPFLFNKLVIPVGVIVPVGAIFLTFLVDYGLLEFIGVLMHKIMKPIWKTPGRSAVDALASFVGSYSIALLITNRVYSEGKYSVKEAAIIATGFSTVSATFMIIVARTTGLMNIWNIYFWSTLIITFAVTAITVRIPPLSRKENSRREDFNEIKNYKFETALTEGIKTFEKAPSLISNIAANLKDGFKMAMSILPSIMSVGLIGLLLAKFTPLFDYLGYIYYPAVKLFGVPNAFLISKAAALEISEMFLPSLLVAGSSFIARFVTAVVSVSAILFFSASIPCIFSTKIPIKISEVLIIWFERTLFSLVLAIVFALIIF